LHEGRKLKASMRGRECHHHFDDSASGNRSLRLGAFRQGTKNEKNKYCGAQTAESGRTADTKGRLEKGGRTATRAATAGLRIITVEKR